MEDSNRSSNPELRQVSSPSRRVLVQGGLASLVGGLFAPLLPGCSSLPAGTVSEAARKTPASPGFKPVPISTADTVSVPEGYTSHPLAPWGDPVGIAAGLPSFRADASNSAADQALQMGMHHDGIHYFALETGAQANQHGLLAMNHEYVDDGLLHADGSAQWSLEKVRKSQAAHGVSVIEVKQSSSGNWEVVRPSRWARRITANTPMQIQGPAAGHPLLRTSADPTGQRVLGTFNNCGSGITPWGTYLTCEENFVNYFKGPATPDAHQSRWGLKPSSGYRWHEFDERFDATQHPNEFNRFGWVVEIDPMDPDNTPIKRTALGRAAHEGATIGVTADGRAVVYMGEDARFEYITKFVSRDRIQPGGAAANRTLLDHGTLYVARFNADGSGDWLPLVHGQGPLTAANGFADQGEVLIKTRQASDLLGATKMDRPEWTAVDTQRREVYVTLTNNSDRGKAGKPGTDAVNPRAQNTMGNILRWKDQGDFDGQRFSWTHFVLAGDATLERADARGNIRGDAFACPDGLWIDPQGLLWIQTDMSTSAMGKDDLVHMGNNMMLAADTRTGEVRRFLTGPRGCEITGVTSTPDGRTFFINIQHPGENASELSAAANPTAVSSWPHTGGRPRSATVVVRRLDGGVVGT